MGIGASGILLLILIALVLFGPKKLPELGRAIGQTVREFKKGTQGIMDDEPVQPAKPAETQAQVQAPNTDATQSSKRLPE
jgi:sec-independent protein translocase protein TatA